MTGNFVHPHQRFNFPRHGLGAADILGCDVRVYNPRGLPVRDPALENDIKVKVRLLGYDPCQRREYAPILSSIVRRPFLFASCVQELRALTQWSDGHMWVSPEMHGTITAVFKNQIDWSE